MIQGDRGDITLPLTNGAASPVAMGIIIVADAANPGNGAVSGASQNGFVGVVLDPTDQLGYATIRTRGIAQVLAGAAVAAGDQIASNGAGKGITQAVAASGAAVKPIIGVALSSAAAADVFIDVLIQPKYTVG